MKKLLVLFIVLISMSACKEEPKKEANNDAFKAEAQVFLDEYTKTFVKLYYDYYQAKGEVLFYIKLGLINHLLVPIN